MTNKVWSLLEDLNQKKGITEVVINGPKKVFVERAGQFIQLNYPIPLEDLHDFANEVANNNSTSFSDEDPIIDGRLPDGSRINIIHEKFSQGAPAITIRKYLKSINSFDQNPNIFGLNEHWVKLLKAMVSSRMNVIVSGGTGVGKTTFMNLMLAELSQAERVITIEDTIELAINIPNVVRLEGSFAGKNKNGIGARDLVRNTLRMRPDRIIIGEVRGGELFDLLQAMNTGHDGSMSSVHASSPAECLSRIENLFLMAGFDVPNHVVRKQIAMGIDFIIQITRDREGNRVLGSILELTGMEGNNILSQQIALREEGEIVSTGITPKNIEKLCRMGGLEKDFFNQ
ncbi:ATPase, T2SS/T4P/T4SS family [Bacteriovoracaceae bacterium]|nr:ATPase, T2SS/T4P/T4SS family [Bacteriovoracaceae bacterium]|tara:strand:+ start:137222 stop:138250 length:1029 start_codon:yes stop_codon:yes gene_type:complete